MNYFDSNGVTRDTGRALEHFSRAAEAGNKRPQLTLGPLYLYGWGTPVQLDRAKFWLHHAHTAGVGEAEYYMRVVEREILRHKL
jgi:TPR repeat protein